MTISDFLQKYKIRMFPIFWPIIFFPLILPLFLHLSPCPWGTLCTSLLQMHPVFWQCYRSSLLTVHATCKLICSAVLVIWRLDYCNAPGLLTTSTTKPLHSEEKWHSPNLHCFCFSLVEWATNPNCRDDHIFQKAVCRIMTKTKYKFGIIQIFQVSYAQQGCFFNQKIELIQ